MATKKKTATRTAKVARPKAAGSAKGAAKKTAKKRNPQNIAIFALLAAIVFMSIGFAAYSQTLNIGSGLNNTDVVVEANSWNVCWQTATPTESETGSATGEVSRDSCNQVTFNATLDKPGDAYSFTLNAENNGTINAKLTAITMTTLTTEQEKYLDYTVSYNGSTYNASASGLNIALNAGSTAPVVVTVTYKNAAAADLPTTQQSIALTAAFDYSDNL